MRILFPSFFSSGGHDIFWYWEQCDAAAKVVIGLVAALSVWSVCAIANKLQANHSFRRQNARYEVRLNANKTKITRQKLERHPDASPYEMLTIEAVIACAKYNRAIVSERDVEICMRHVENAVQRGMARVMKEYEKSLVLLSSFAAGGPFLGLLGTVWGIIITFGSLTEKATIAQLAPGVAGALVATLSGLLLAIPAVFFYNIILTGTKQLTMEIEAFASLLLDRIELELNEQLRDSEKTVPVAEEALSNREIPSVADTAVPASETPAGGFRNPYADR